MTLILSIITPRSFFLYPAGADLPNEERKIVQPIFKKSKTEQTSNDHRSASKASTTPLVHHIFESEFAKDGVLDDSEDHFATKSTIKKEVKKEKEEDDGDESGENDEEKFAQNTQHRRRHLSKEERKGKEKRICKRGFEGEWIGPSIGSKRKKDFYSGVSVDGKEYRVGDHVLITGKLSLTIRFIQFTGKKVHFIAFFKFSNVQRNLI